MISGIGGPPGKTQSLLKNISSGQKVAAGAIGEMASAVLAHEGTKKVEKWSRQSTRQVGRWSKDAMHGSKGIVNSMAEKMGYVPASSVAGAPDGVASADATNRPRRASAEQNHGVKETFFGLPLGTRRPAEASAAAMSGPPGARLPPLGAGAAFAGTAPGGVSGAVGYGGTYGGSGAGTLPYNYGVPMPVEMTYASSGQPFIHVGQYAELADTGEYLDPETARNFVKQTDIVEYAELADNVEYAELADTGAAQPGQLVEDQEKSGRPEIIATPEPDAKEPPIITGGYFNSHEVQPNLEASPGDFGDRPLSSISGEDQQASHAVHESTKDANTQQNVSIINPDAHNQPSKNANDTSINPETGNAGQGHIPSTSVVAVDYSGEDWGEGWEAPQGLHGAVQH